MVPKRIIGENYVEKTLRLNQNAWPHQTWFGAQLACRQLRQTQFELFRPCQLYRHRKVVTVVKL